MNKKINYELEVFRMLEIEDNILLGSNFNLSSNEFEYLKFATKMPLSEMKTFIEFYDNSSPKYDELKFVSMLITRYNENQDNIIKRIQQVRKIMRYEKELKESKIFSKTLNK